MRKKENITVVNAKGENVEPNPMQSYLMGRGWHQYYHHDYWVNPKTIEDPTRQDYTNFGGTLNEALAFEKGYDKALKDNNIN